jgi:hypothetical protein
MDPKYRGPGYEIYELDEALNVEICYPRNDPPRYTVVEVGLSDVRAADAVRITYDFERDGWSILQGVWADGLITEWKEIHFARAWAFE